MASAANSDDLNALAPAWHELQSRTPVKLRTVENERHYRAMVDLMNKLVDEIDDRETHPLMGLLDIVKFFVRDHEERNVDIRNRLQFFASSWNNTVCGKLTLLRFLAPSQMSVRS